MQVLGQSYMVREGWRRYFVESSLKVQSPAYLSFQDKLGEELSSLNSQKALGKNTSKTREAFFSDNLFRFSNILGTQMP